MITPDLYSPTRGWVVEAKRSAGRAYVRTAIGQVLDYAHNLERAGKPATPAVLLPGQPDDDLKALLKKLGILLIVRSGDGFEVS